MEYLSDFILLTIRYLPLMSGAYITIMILKTADLTIEPSWSISGILAALLIQYTTPLIASISGLFFGGIFGLFTGSIFALLGRKKLLSGLISYTILTSVGYHLLGDKSNIFLDTKYIRFGFLNNFDATLYYAFASLISFALVLIWNKSKLGIIARLLGENPYSSIFYKFSINKYYILNFIIANSLIGFGGSLWSIYFGFANNTQGIGLIFTAFISLLIGFEIIKLFNISKRVDIFIIIIGTSLFVLFSMLSENILSTLQLYNYQIKATDKNLFLALFLIVLISMNRSSIDKNNIVSEW